MTVTEGRPDLIVNAISCYYSQTYKNKELVVVSQGTVFENSIIRELVECVEGAFFVDAPSNLSLGAMRNLSIELTTGDIICQWDDDDFYHPQRLMSQYKRLRGRSVACLYTQHLKYFKDKNQMYWIDYKRGTDDYVSVAKRCPYKKFLTGSVMFLKDCFYQYKNNLYPEWNCEEDLDVLQKLMKLGSVEEVNDGHQYVYVFHDGNTYDRHHHEMVFHKKHIFTSDELLERRFLLEDSCDKMGLRQIDFCTSPIVDFDKDDQLGTMVAFTSS